MVIGTAVEVMVAVVLVTKEVVQAKGTVAISLTANVLMVNVIVVDYQMMLSVLFMGSINGGSVLITQTEALVNLAGKEDELKDAAIMVKDILETVMVTKVKEELRNPIMGELLYPITVVLFNLIMPKCTKIPTTLNLFNLTSLDPSLTQGRKSIH